MTTSTSYEATKYEYLAFPETHPRRLAAVALLHGWRAPSPESARVLEVGCAGGGNLLPMAATLPSASFVGVDFSPSQIDDARAVAEEAALDNVTFAAEDLRDFDPDGEYDYIIAHGFYSWVERDVRDRLFEICQSSLTPCGLLYASYNTLPGWFQRQAARDYMLMRTAAMTAPTERATRARSCLEELANAAVENKASHASLIAAEVERIRDAEDEYFLHDQLEETNDAVYFRDFVSHARSFGLDYVVETRFRGTPGANPPGLELPPDADPIEREQLRDFVNNQEFRRSLLGRQGARRGGGGAEALTSIDFALLAPAQIERASGCVRVRLEGAQLALPQGSVALSLIERLSDRWPDSASLAQLVDDVGNAKGEATQQLLQLIYSGVVVAEMPSDASNSRERGDTTHPTVTPLTRAQAERGPAVTNWRHENVRLTDFQRLVVARLDGSRTVAELVSWATAMFGGEEKARRAMGGVLEELRRAAVLVA